MTTIMPDDAAARREIAGRIRERGVFECADLAYALGNGCSVGARCEDCREWMAERLARLVEPQCDREALSSLADRIGLIEHDDSRSGCEACEYFGRPDRDCERCAAYSSEERCLELAAKDAARRIREALSLGIDERVRSPKVLAADGEPLEAGQTVYATHYGYVKCTVLAIEWVVDGYLVEVENECGHRFRKSPDEFIHQCPAFDADGVPCCIGDEVWDIHIGEHQVIEDITGTCGGYETLVVRLDSGEQTTCDAVRVSHRKPVLDAAGVPIKKGDAVWHVTSCREYVVIEPSHGETVVVRLAGHDDADGEQYAPERLTHTAPDSWERVEEDKDLNPFDYCKKVGHKPWTFDNAEEFKASDIVRRCKALAERGE